MFDTAAPTGVVVAFQESPVALLMSSACLLLIFQPSIGNEHVRSCAHSFLPPALVWLHLSPCKIRTRFNCFSSKQHLSEGRWRSEMLLNSFLQGARLYSLVYLCRLDPIMLHFKCFVTAERAGYSGLLLLRASVSEGPFFLQAGESGECFQFASQCLFIEYFLTPTYTIIVLHFVLAKSLSCF